jgi:transcriptional regulator with GAF, ATPase, and Fis domain
MDALCRYHWPGNVRELQNVIERAVIISTGTLLELDVADLKFPKATRPEAGPATAKSPTNGALHDVLQETERQQILEALKECNWVVAGPHGAAARLGMKRSTLQKRVHRLGIARSSA